MSLAEFNSLSGPEAEAQLYSCFAHRKWAAHVSAGRPYAGLSSLLAAAETAWCDLAPSDWLEAFTAHPRIGERGGHTPDNSHREQTRVMEAPHQTLAALANDNRRYEEHFGHVFLIAASGRSAEEILQSLRQRMGNDPATELEVAANEQRKITQLRLEQLLK